MAKFAAYTKVPVERTRAEIETVVKRYGAKTFASMTEDRRAVIMFEAKSRRLRFDLPLPDPVKRPQECRALWRALLLCIKAKLESVETGIETFDEAFLSHIVMPNGETVGETAIPALQQSYESGRMLPLLPPPRGNAP